MVLTFSFLRGALGGGCLCGPVGPGSGKDEGRSTVPLISQRPSIEELRVARSAPRRGRAIAGPRRRCMPNADGHAAPEGAAGGGGEAGAVHGRAVRMRAAILAARARAAASEARPALRCRARPLHDVALHATSARGRGRELRTGSRR